MSRKTHYVLNFLLDTAVIYPVAAIMQMVAGTLEHFFFLHHPFKLIAS